MTIIYYLLKMVMFILYYLYSNTSYGFTKENTFAKVTLFITVSRTMEILDGKMEIKNKRCYWCYRTCNGVDIRSSSWRKSIVKGKTIYDMVSAVDALLYKTEKIHILS